VSAREDVLRELASRLAGITTSNGYNTNAGQKVFLGQEPNLGPNDPTEALAIVVGADSPGYQGENVAYEVTVEIQALVRADVSDPLLAMEAVLADIKKAVEQDHDLGGLLIERGLERGSTRPFDRETGSEYPGVGIEYNLYLQEAWGDP
jgi:hypothetical protein